MRAAASSIASGRWSSRRQISVDLAVRRELDAGRSDPLVEERDRVRLAQRQDDVLALAGEVERLPARDEQRELGAGGEELRELGRGRKQVLEVVEQEQQPLGADVLGEILLRPEDLRDRRADERRLAQGGEPDPEDAVRVELGDVGGRLRGEPGLARSARSGQRQQPSPLVREQRAHLLELALAPEEGRRRHGQIRLVERCERRELLLAELEEPLRR